MNQLCFKMLNIVPKLEGVVHTCNPRTWKIDLGESGVRVILGYMYEYRHSLGYLRGYFQRWGREPARLHYDE